VEDGHRPPTCLDLNLVKKKGKNSLYPLKFQGFFNFNPKVSKLAIYPPEVSKSGNLNPC
jgi:hypothetical protein